jgi:hypothetical protein
MDFYKALCSLNGDQSSWKRVIQRQHDAHEYLMLAMSHLSGTSCARGKVGLLNPFVQISYECPRCGLIMHNDPGEEGIIISLERFESVERAITSHFSRLDEGENRTCTRYGAPSVQQAAYSDLILMKLDARNAFVEVKENRWVYQERFLFFCQGVSAQP